MTENKEVEEHFDDIASSYDRYKEMNSFYYDQLKRLIKEISCNYPSKRVLDIGCGTGDILASLSPEMGLGIDISSGMIKIAKEKHQKYDFIAGDLLDLSFDQNFDVILLIDVIEHLGDVNGYLSRINEISDQNTKLIISSPSYHWRLPLYIFEKINMKMPEGTHKWIHPKALNKMVKNNGFRIIENDYRILVPKRIPIISDALNPKFYNIPLIRNAGLIYYLVCELQ